MENVLNIQQRKQGEEKKMGRGKEGSLRPQAARAKYHKQGG